MTETVVAVDMGSGGVRAAVLDATGATLAQCSVPCRILSGGDGRSVHLTEEVWDAVVCTVHAVSEGSTPSAVVFAGTAHALLTGTPEDPDPEIVLWSDSRSASAQAELAARGLYAGYGDITACPVHAAYWPAKITWLRSTGRLSPGRSLLFSEKDLVVHRLTGRLVADTSTAGATGLLDVGTLDWSVELLRRLDVPWLTLPPVAETTTALRLSRDGERALGLASGTPVVLGGIDGALAHIGVGGTAPGVASLTVGTSLAVRMHAAAPHRDGAGRCWSYPLARDQWVVGGAGSNGGNLMTWLRDAVFDEAEPVEEIIAGALAMPSDPGLVVLPYLNGERAPLWRSDFSGGIVGLRPGHTRWHLARAALDAVACMIHELSEAVFSLVGRAELVGLNGGFTASRGWAQLATDAIGVRSGLPGADAAVLRGAAAVAWAGIGQHPITASPDDFADVLTPDAGVHAAVEAMHARLVAVRELLFGA